VDHTADVRHISIHVGMGGGVRGRGVAALDQCAEEVGDDHVFRGQLVVSHAGRLDHDQVVAGHSCRDVAGGPDHEAVSREFAM